MRPPSISQHKGFCSHALASLLVKPQKPPIIIQLFSRLAAESAPRPAECLGCGVAAQRVMGIFRGECNARMHWGKAGWPRWAACFDGAREYPDTWCSFGCAVRVGHWVGHPSVNRSVSPSVTRLASGAASAALPSSRCVPCMARHVPCKSLPNNVKETCRRTRRCQRQEQVQGLPGHVLAVDDWMLTGPAKERLNRLMGGTAGLPQELDPGGKFRSLSDVWEWNAADQSGASVPLDRCCSPGGFKAECTCRHRPPCTA